MGDGEMQERPLEAAERGVFQKILSQDPSPCARDLLAQVQHVRVSGGIPTFLRLALTTPSEPSACPDGPIPVRALVGSEGDEDGEILVWVKAGFLSGLEFAWFTDEMPTAFPDPTLIRLTQV
jgi:hypothetical protein